MAGIADTAADILAIARGMGVTLRHLFSKPVTLQYPEVRPELPPRHRGRHELQYHEDGLGKCVGCELCEAVCPAYAIYVEGAENPPDAPVSIGERYAKTWTVNYLRCIFCGFCVEACPTEALQMRQVFELSDYTREAAIFTKDMLMASGPKSAEQRKAEDESWMPG
jgi:NADH-quinone oxidoreductase subunit I